MYCSKCLSLDRQKIPSQRFSQTLYHEPIFEHYQENNVRIRNTPTFRSSLFPKYQKPQLKRRQKQNPQQNCKNNKSRLSKDQMKRSSSTFDNRRPNLSQHQLLWFDSGKYPQLKSGSICVEHGYPTQRKLLELSSYPIGDYSERCTHKIKK